MALDAEELLRSLSWLAVVVVLYLGLRHWLAYKRRSLIHRERLAAIDKGVDLGPLEGDIRQAAITARTTLLLAGLLWISCGVGLFVVLVAILGEPSNVAQGYSLPPQGTQWIGIPVVAIGVSHLIVYVVTRGRS
jgi:hypothetical protein